MHSQGRPLAEAAGFQSRHAAVVLATGPRATNRKPLPRLAPPPGSWLIMRRSPGWQSFPVRGLECESGLVPETGGFAHALTAGPRDAPRPPEAVSSPLRLVAYFAEHR